MASRGFSGSVNQFLCWHSKTNLSFRTHVKVKAHGPNQARCLVVCGLWELTRHMIGILGRETSHKIKTWKLTEVDHHLWAPNNHQVWTGCFILLRWKFFLSISWIGFPLFKPFQNSDWKQNRTKQKRRRSLRRTLRECTAPGMMKGRG